jgi:molybdopterin-guanine dinucleotide biosynthesis protein A
MPSMTRSEGYDAVVLAGGTGRRLGGIDKPAVRIGATTLLDRVLLSVQSAARVVVVGPERQTAQPVLWTREDPPGGGPVAAIEAGLRLVRSPVVAVLAADLPFLTVDVIELLRAGMSADGALLVDDTGRHQLLVGVWRTEALRSALPTDAAGARLSTMLATLDPALVSLPPAGDRPPVWFDCDTADDVTTARMTG